MHRFMVNIKSPPIFNGILEIVEFDQKREKIRKKWRVENMRHARLPRPH